MRIGIPAETKPGEQRVALVPRDVMLLAADGHEVRVQAGAGTPTGHDDDAYRSAGARIVDRIAAWDCELVIKVKELQDAEFASLEREQAVLGFHQLPGNPERTRRICASGIIAIAYETVRDTRGKFPLLAPMSVISGRMAIDVAKRHLGHAPRNVLVLGAGNAGDAAAQAARDTGATVTVLRRATATPEAVERAALAADLVVGAVFVAGMPTPKLLSRALVARMKRGAMIVDICIDGGGVAETSRATTHADPVFVAEDVIHYAVENMPSAVPREATEAISAAVLPYARAIASQGVAAAARADAGLAAGILAWKGSVTYESIAREAGVPYTPVSDSIAHG